MLREKTHWQDRAQVYTAAWLTGSQVGYRQKEPAPFMVNDRRKEKEGRGRGKKGAVNRKTQ